MLAYSFRNICRFVSVLLLLGSLPSLPAKAAEPAPDALKEAIKDVIRENPDLILDILRNNSETVLDIAQQGNILRRRKALLTQWENDAKHPKHVDLEGRAFRGSPDAPVTIVSYSDHMCSFCRQAEDVIAFLLRKYDGKIRVTFKALPSDDPVSKIAAQYVTAAFLLDASKGWDFFDALFAGQQSLARDGEAFLKEKAARSGFDFKMLKKEATGERVAERLEQDRKEADRLGISGTPHFLVNDLFVRGAVGPEIFEEAIEKALELAKK